MALTKISDAAVIVSSVEDDKIEKLAHLKGSPNAQTIIKICLSVGCRHRFRQYSIRSVINLHWIFLTG